MTRFRGFHRILILTTAICLLSLSIVQSKGPGGKSGSGSLSYNIVKLDDGGGVFAGQAYDINASRLIVGGVSDLSESGAAAAYWSITGSGRTLETNIHILNGGEIAFGCNDDGEIVGIGNDSAVYWASTSADGQVLPALAGDTRSAAEDISIDGVICGWSQSAPDSKGQRRSSAVVWRVTDSVDGPVIWGPLELEVVGSIPGVADFSSSCDVSAQDADGIVTIVGESNFAALAWTISLADDGGLQTEATTILDVDGYATGTNDTGIICGRVILNTTPAEAATWIAGVGQLLDLGQFSGTVAQPNDVNDNGVVVGEGYIGVGSSAVVWASPHTSLIELNPKNSHFDSLDSANAVNKAAEIVGCGRVNGIFIPFLAIPK